MTRPAIALLSFAAGLLTASYAKWALRFLLELHETDEIIVSQRTYDQLIAGRPDSEMAAVT